MANFSLQNQRLLKVALDNEKVLSRAGAMVAYDGQIKFDKAILGGLQATGTMLGLRNSGEERQVDFTGEGTVLVQSSEEALQGRSDVQALIAQVAGLHQNDLQKVSAVISERLRGS